MRVVCLRRIPLTVVSKPYPVWSLFVGSGASLSFGYVSLAFCCPYPACRGSFFIRAQTNPVGQADKLNSESEWLGTHTHTRLVIYMCLICLFICFLSFLLVIMSACAYVCICALKLVAPWIPEFHSHIFICEKPRGGELQSRGCRVKYPSPKLPA